MTGTGEEGWIYREKQEMVEHNKGRLRNNIDGLFISIIYVAVGLLKGLVDMESEWIIKELSHKFA